MDLTPPTGYRPYDPNPRTATGIQALTTDQVGSGYQTLTSAVAKRLAQRAPASQMRHVVCFDLYHSPDMDVFLAQFRAAWETAYGPATWIDTRPALKESAVLARELQEFLTEDPVFGRVCDRDLTLFFHAGRWQTLIETVQAALRSADGGPIFIMGPGALLSPLRFYSDVALYAAVPRETIFLPLRLALAATWATIRIGESGRATSGVSTLIGRYRIGTSLQCSLPVIF